MSDLTPNSVSLSFDPNDDRPLPERIAEGYGFPLAYHDLDDGKRYYAIQDWIVGVAQTSQPRVFLSNMKQRAKKAKIELFSPCKQLPYIARDGKRYKIDHADAETLYKITQRMDTETGLRNKVLEYLAKAGVILDEMERNPDEAQQYFSDLKNNKEYRKLLDEGFSPQEAEQWLTRRAAGIQTRKWVTEIWRKRGAKNRFGTLTNEVSRIVHGKSATIRKKEMGLGKNDTMRNYDAAADQYLTSVTEMTAGALHEWRNSEGFAELLEDVEDTRPLVDAARPHAYQIFSKKPRRLEGKAKPAIADPESEA